MPGQIELEITWDGPVKGLVAHRVSLNEFGGALTALVTAARRIASNLITSAAEPAESGRLAKAAKNIDIELSALVKGSGGFKSLLTFDVAVSDQAEMFNSLAESVGKELLESIESESSGKHRNAMVRKYLQALPQALTSQKYDLFEDGRSIKSITLGKMDLPELLFDPLPALLEIQGRISGVGFDPKWEVKVKGEGGNQVTATATEKQVMRALVMRTSEVRSFTVSSAIGTRLVVLENGEMQRKRLTMDDIFNKWDATFRALA